MFQESGSLHGDEMPVPDATLDDFDVSYFKSVFERITDMRFEEQTIPLVRLLANMNLMRDGRLSVAGMVLFGNENVRYKLSRAGVKAVCYAGTELADNSYADRGEFYGKLADIYQQTVSFCMRNVGKRQAEMSFNSQGDAVVPKIVFEELVTNALIHRDFFVADTVKVFVFSDRVEIVSPGHLPNSLTIENILSGNSCARNNVIVSYATRLVQFSGLGSGIRRALRAYKDIEFEDDRVNNRFKAVIRFPEREGSGRVGE